MAKTLTNPSLRISFVLLTDAEASVAEKLLGERLAKKFPESVTLVHLDAVATPNDELVVAKEHGCQAVRFSGFLAHRLKPELTKLAGPYILDSESEGIKLVSRGWDIPDGMDVKTIDEIPQSFLSANPDYAESHSYQVRRWLWFFNELLRREEWRDGLKLLFPCEWHSLRSRAPRAIAAFEEAVASHLRI